MKNLLLNLCVVASCITISAQSMNATASVVAAPSTTSLAVSLQEAQKRNNISDEELFGAKVSYSTELSQSQSNGAVGEGFWVPAGIVVAYLVSCVKMNYKEILSQVCTGEGTQRRCEMQVTGVEREIGIDCPF
jgi:hypothetical protein